MSWAESLQYKVERLEHDVALKQASSDAAVELAELYFLTSRCTDVKKLLTRRKGIEAAPRALELLCVCGGKCPRSGLVADLMDFKKTLHSSGSWKNLMKNSKNKKLWKKISEVPEARAMALTRLRHERRLSSELLTLERELDGMDIK